MISVKNLFKNFGTTEALKDIGFSVDKGEIYGIAAVRGSGKTTLLSILSGRMNADAGEVIINGLDAKKESDKIKNNVAYINIDNYKTISSLLASPPPVVLLDEPTTGLDEVDKEAIFSTVLQLQKLGVAILFATNHMDEIERLCNRIGVLFGGTLLAQGTLEDLRTLSKAIHTISILITNIKEDRVENENLVSKFISEELTEAPGGDFRFRNGHLQYFTKEVEPALLRLKNRLAKYQFEIASTDIERPSLERIYLGLAGKKFLNFS